MNPSVYRSLLTALLILLAAGAVAAGAPLDDAKRHVAAADKTVADVGPELQAIARALGQQLAALAEVAVRLDRQHDLQREAVPLVARAVEAANGELAAARRDAASAARALRDAEAVAARARSEASTRRAAVARAASAEREAFEASPAYRDAHARAVAAEATAARERARVDAALRGDPQVAPLVAAAERAERDVATAREATPVDDGALAEASGLWIDAKNALATASATHYADDAACAAAVDAASRAARERTALADAFDRSILTTPGVAEAQLALRDAAHASDSADAAVGHARDALARTGRWLAARRSTAEAVARIARAANDGLVEATRDLERARLAMRQSGEQLAASAARLLAARQDLDAAGDAITAAERANARAGDSSNGRGKSK